MTASNSKQAAICGAWPSPISAAIVAAGASPLSQVAIDGAEVLWLAGRASEGGRNTLLRQRGGRVEELTPAPLNVRSRVHEYGGGAMLAVDGDAYFSNFADNRLYVARDGAEPVALSAEGTRRYADFVLDRRRQRLIAVCEDHAGGGHHPVNMLCAVGLDGVETILAEGSDFYAAPRLSPDGSQLAWLSWMHPNMPWQGTELWLADVDAGGALANARLVAGGADEAICQPEWSPSGVLHFVSDRSGWWNLYRFDGAALQPLCDRAAEFGSPHWTFGGSMYGFRSDKEIVCTYIENGVSRLAQLSTATGKLQPIANPYEEIRELRVAGDIVALLGGAPTIPLELARIDLSTGARKVLARSIADLPDESELSVPESISYPTSGKRLAHAFYYPPRNAHYEPAPGSKPPLMVISHGGPTGMASNTLKLATQFWTSRGFAVLDVNYGGSSGFGRAYRDALKGQWGVIDVDDCVAGARHLAARGMVDPDRLVIRGGSAGGLTTLCALTFHDVFKAGASYYGVSDLKGLDDDSHKFESHYNEYLIAPQPEAEMLYMLRSPIHHAGQIKRPMIFFQGLDDKVVPPQQSEVMVEALRNAGVPVAYITLEGEGHGFRKAESIVRTLEAELYFYQRIFGIAPPGAPAPVAIENLPDAA
ncbi:S9 family peptidase [Massilia sp. R2A-15]|uniref:dipeptidyl-peptidase 5 n=1 Tax=Massilia sp. R2A-15 TaxID=3064278 RepID=UPI0027359A7E|nr:S9 family peptidase [Massilia sp. R2A-15]WLI88879.1 S9 family peptidase [Massilia sp. R2A-15]